MEIKIIPSQYKRGKYIKQIKPYGEPEFISVEVMSKKQAMEFLLFKTTVQRCSILTDNDIVNLCKEKE